MGHFVFIDYTGEDSGVVLARILGEDGKDDGPHEIDTETQRVVGFTLNPDDDDEEEGAEDEPDAD